MCLAGHQGRFCVSADENVSRATFELLSSQNPEIFLITRHFSERHIDELPRSVHAPGFELRLSQSALTCETPELAHTIGSSPSQCGHRLNDEPRSIDDSVMPAVHQSYSQLTSKIGCDGACLH